MKRASLILWVSFNASSGHAAPPIRPDEAAINRWQRQSVLLMQIEKRCKLPETSFELLGERLSFKPPLNASYRSVDCALRGLKKSGAFPKMGFVGNEAYASEQN